MNFSKSLGYAIRGILYVASKGNTDRKIQIDEIAKNLNVPRYFLAKILKEVVKEGILTSTKGHRGGFSMNEKTLDTSLLTIAQLLGEFREQTNCVLRFQNCDNANPCPLHHRVGPFRSQWVNFMSSTKVKDLITSMSGDFVNSIATH